MEDTTDDDVALLDSGEARVRRRCVTVEPAMLLYAVFQSAVGPVQQQYIYDRIGRGMNASTNGSLPVCTSNHSDPAYVTDQEIQSVASQWMIYLMVCSMLPAFFSTVFIGGYSDVGGRKVAMISPLIGSVIKIYILLAVIIYELPIHFLLVGGFLEGAVGSMAMFIMAMFSYISDITTRQQRSLRIILLELTLGLGITLAYLTSGYLIAWLGYLGTTLILHITAVVTLIVVYLLPETLEKQNVPFWSLQHFKKSFRVYLHDDGSGRRTLLLVALLVLVFALLPRLGSDDVTTLVLLNSPLCWSSVLIGYFKASYYLVLSLSSLLVARFVQPRVGDLPLVILGCLSGAVMGVYWSFAHTTLMVFLVPLAGLFSSLVVGMVRAFTSKIVSKHELGSMFAWVALLEVLCALLGDVSFNATYRATLSWFHGFVFLIIALFFLIAAGVAGILLKLSKRRQNQLDEGES